MPSKTVFLVEVFAAWKRPFHATTTKNQVVAFAQDSWTQTTESIFNSNNTENGISWFSFPLLAIFQIGVFFFHTWVYCLSRSSVLRRTWMCRLVGMYPQAKEILDFIISWRRRFFFLRWFYDDQQKQRKIYCPSLYVRSALKFPFWWFRLSSNWVVWTIFVLSGHSHCQPVEMTSVANF